MAQAIDDLQSWQHRASQQGSQPGPSAKDSAPAPADCATSRYFGLYSKKALAERWLGYNVSGLGAGASLLSKKRSRDKTARNTATKLLRSLNSAEQLDRHFTRAGADACLVYLADLLENAVGSGPVVACKPGKGKMRSQDSKTQRDNVVQHDQPHDAMDVTAAMLPITAFVPTDQAWADHLGEDHGAEIFDISSQTGSEDEARCQPPQGASDQFSKHPMKTCLQTHADDVHACAAHDHSSQSYLTYIGESCPDDPSNAAAAQLRAAIRVYDHDFSVFAKSYIPSAGKVPEHDAFFPMASACLQLVKQVLQQSSNSELNLAVTKSIENLMAIDPHHWLFQDSKQFETALAQLRAAV